FFEPRPYNIAKPKMLTFDTALIVLAGNRFVCGVRTYEGPRQTKKHGTMMGPHYVFRAPIYDLLVLICAMETRPVHTGYAPHSRIRLPLPTFGGPALRAVYSRKVWPLCFASHSFCNSVGTAPPLRSRCDGDHKNALFAYWPE